MPYFKRIEDYRTYSADMFDFHFDYNANSGGGQAFLGGSFDGGDGTPRQPKELEGMPASLAFGYHDLDGREVVIDLGRDAKVQYAISPRGSGSSQMKLSMMDKVRPSLVYPALLLLPATCGVNMAESLDVSPLTQGNYWLRSMWLKCLFNNSGNPLLIPKDFVFGGGSSKKGASDGKVTGAAEFYLLNHEQRARDILWASDHSSVLPDAVSEPLHCIANVLRSQSDFSYASCSEATAALMRGLARLMPEAYSGYSDPLPVIIDLLANKGAVRATPNNDVSEPRNLIYFGAPGTGKSYELSRAAGENFPEENISRVTFYPDYTYSQFVGCFKPVTRYENADDAPLSKASAYISYEFVPGPFLSSYVKAVQNPDENYLLIVEEINRANPAAVFGDVFQLLDRKATGESEYEIAVPREMQSYLEIFLPEYATTAHITEPVKLLEEQERLKKESGRLALPSNLYIWATMNSADQGVFPMDTAFKRRWDFRYIGIDAGEDASVEIDGVKRPLCDVVVRWGKGGEHCANWNNLRKAINDFLVSDKVKLNEDKLLGPFFVKPEALTQERFAATFKDKVLLYLFEDACKTKHSKVFSSDLKTYSQICDAFDERGIDIFVDDFKKYYSEEADDGSEDDGEAEE